MSNTTTRARCRATFVLAALAAMSSSAWAQPPSAEALTPPKLLHNVEPEYPDEERPSRKEAVVVLTIELDATGRVVDAIVMSSAGPLFDRAAQRAAKELSFEPATRDGKAIPSKIPFTFHFAPATEPPTATEAATATATTTPTTTTTTTTTTTAIADIEVKGERVPREATQRVMKAAELARIPGTNGDALHAVENMPGVARTNGVSPNLIVRGSAPADTAVFADGTWLPSAFHFGGLTSVLPTEVLERLDFYPGNFSAQYGRQMGGIIDLGIRSPRKDRIGGLAQIDMLDGRLLAEGPLGPSTRFLVAGRRSWVDAWLGPVSKSGGGEGFRTTPVYYDYQAMLEHDIDSKTTARLLLFGADDRFALTLSSPNASDPTAGGDLSASSRFLRLQARTDTRWSDAVRWTNMASWGTETERFRMGGIQVENTFQLVNVRSDLRATLMRGLTASAGFDGFGGTYDVDVLVPPSPPDGQVAGPAFGSPLRHLQGEGSLWRPAGYALFDITPIDGIKIMPGVRADYSTDIKRWSVDPRIAARVDVASGFPRTTIKGGVGSFHQPPLPQQSLAPWGSPSVRYNHATHYSLGFEQELSRDVEVSVEGFYKKFDDLVTSSLGATTSGNSYDNLGSGRAYGSELLVRWKPGGRFFGWLAYTLSRSERRTRPSEPLSLMEFDQTHILNALGSYSLGRGWTLGGRFRFVTGELYTPYMGGILDLDAGAYAPIASPSVNSGRLANFHSLDLRVDKTWTFSSWKLTAYLDVRNVYNRRNPEALSYNYNYSQTEVVAGFPILPILGLRGEL